MMRCRHCKLLRFLTVTFFFDRVQAVAIDNAVSGEPTIICGSEEINFWANTEKPFRGKVYVKGKYGKPECTFEKQTSNFTTTNATMSSGQMTQPTGVVTFRPQSTCPPCPACSSSNGFATLAKYSAGPSPPRFPRDTSMLNKNNENVAHLKIVTGTCDMKRERTLNPPGVTLTVTVVVSFHELFVTKIDRAYQLRCFYMEADKTVSSVLDVSAFSQTTELIVQADMPNCQYSIRRDSADGPELKFAKVGDSVFHNWHCTTTMPGMFGMLVHSCHVEDGKGKKVQVLNNKGCTLDKYVMNNLVYANSLKASVESHVFKFADRTVVDFQCIISICPKTNGGCDAITPPVCVEKREKRELIFANNSNDLEVYSSTDWNLHAQKFVVLDIDENIPLENLKMLEEKAARYSQTLHDDEFLIRKEELSYHQILGKTVCLSAVGFGVLISSCTCVLTLVSIVFAYLYLIKYKFEYANSTADAMWYKSWLFPIVNNRHYIAGNNL